MFIENLYLASNLLPKIISNEYVGKHMKLGSYILFGLLAT